ncbi:MAG TPA: hypothetical protein VLU92_07450 [Candidatus Dormibacteraeota bacterium]|nr:hypothetical protein [Candidatus Dormibacteraeota bacterium]
MARAWSQDLLAEGRKARYVDAGQGYIGHGPEGMTTKLSGLTIEEVQMIHFLLVIAVVLFVLWLLFHAAGALVNLIWLAIIVLLVIWLIGFVRGRSATS